MNIGKLPRTLVLGLITFYQRTLSPDYGALKGFFPYGFCPQHPTCSEYAKQIITERGVIIGGAMAFKRTLSCHPWKKPTEEKMRETAKKALE